MKEMSGAEGRRFWKESKGALGMNDVMAISYWRFTILHFILLSSFTKYMNTGPTTVHADETSHTFLPKRQVLSAGTWDCITGIWTPDRRIPRKADEHDVDMGEAMTLPDRKIAVAYVLESLRIWLQYQLTER